MKPAADDFVDEIDVFDGRQNRIAFEQVLLSYNLISNVKKPSERNLVFWVIE